MHGLPTWARLNAEASKRVAQFMWRRLILTKEADAEPTVPSFLRLLGIDVDSQWPEFATVSCVYLPALLDKTRKLRELYPSNRSQNVAHSIVVSNFTVLIVNRFLACLTRKPPNSFHVL